MSILDTLAMCVFVCVYVCVRARVCVRVHVRTYVCGFADLSLPLLALN